MEKNNDLASEVLKQLKDQHQEECDRLHTVITRLLVALCIVTTLLVGTICYQIYSSYLPTEDTTITQDSKDGQNNYIGNNGEINNGETNNKNN